MTQINELLGKTVKSIDVYNEENEIIFTTIEDKKYRMYHYQDCCESVYIEDICGDLNDLIDCELVEAEEVTNNENPKEHSDDSFTWTFYKFRTKKGCVTIRWYGESNGYYSESVDFEEI